MVLTIAHRGGAALVPENTLEAFADALGRGCDGVELDVQLSRDDIPVVHHDLRLTAGLARKDGQWLKQPGPCIKDLSLSELQQFEVGAPDPGSDYAARHPLLHPISEARIPTLKEVVRLARGAARPFLLMIELKCNASNDSCDPLGLAEHVCSVIVEEGFMEGTIFVGFDWGSLLHIKACAPMAQCWFSTDSFDLDAEAVIGEIARAGAQGWFSNYRNITPETLRFARKQRLKVGAWTVNNPAQMRCLMDLDAICTDRPDLLMALL